MLMYLYRAFQLSENTDQSKLEEVFKKHLQTNNFSMGGTELYASKEKLDFLRAEGKIPCNWSSETTFWSIPSFRMAFMGLVRVVFKYPWFCIFLAACSRLWRMSRYEIQRLFWACPMLQSEWNVHMQLQGRVHGPIAQHAVPRTNLFR